MEDSRTVFCGNLSGEITEELLFELFLQVAPLERVKIPTDKEGRQSNFGFVTFKHDVSVPYAVDMLNGTKLFDKQISVKPRKVNNQRNDNPMLMNRGADMPNPHDERGQQYGGYPMNSHLRFNEYGDPGQQMNYEEMLRLQQLGQMLQGYQNFSNPYDSPYNDNHGRHWRDRESDHLRGGDYYRDRENFRDRSDNNRDRDNRGNNRRHDNDRRDHSGYKNKRNDNHRSGGYDRNSRRRY